MSAAIYMRGVRICVRTCCIWSHSSNKFPTLNRYTEPPFTIYYLNYLFPLDLHPSNIALGWSLSGKIDNFYISDYFFIFLDDTEKTILDVLTNHLSDSLTLVNLSLSPPLFSM